MSYEQISDEECHRSLKNRKLLWYGRYSCKTEPTIAQTTS